MSDTSSQVTPSQSSGCADHAEGVLGGGTPCGAGGGPECTPSVLTTCQSPKRERVPWSRKQKRHYQTIMSVLHRWEVRSRSVVWVMLTTGRGGDPRKLRAHLWELERRVCRKVNKSKIEHVVVDTTEGNGVLHILWAAEGSLYVDQAWLSSEWEKIHGARYVWIARYRKGSRGRLSRYMVSQYMSGQAGAGVRISWSWKTIFTVPLKAAWRAIKRASGCDHKRDLIALWERFLGGEMIDLGGWRLSLETFSAVRVLMDLERSGRELQYVV